MRTTTVPTWSLSPPLSSSTCRPLPEPSSTAFMGTASEDAALPDDLVLPYISRMLMEEDIDDKFFYLYPDHPALLQAQQPFAEILISDARHADLSSSGGGGGGGSGSDSAATTDTTNDTLSPCEAASQQSSETNTPTAATTMPADDDSGLLISGHCSRVSMDMLHQAFLKGMEEANKFLPATGTSSLLTVTASSISRGHKKNRHHWDDDDDDDGGLEVEETSTGRRSSKLMAPEQEETGETVDRMVIDGYALCLEQMRSLRVSMGAIEAARSSQTWKWPHGRRRDDESESVDLCTSLIHCAQAVSMDDRRSAGELLRQIKRHSSPRGDANQRLAYCFAEGLEARLAGAGSQLYRSLMVKRTSVVDFLAAYRLYLAATCFKMTAYAFSNITIKRALAAAAAGRKKKNKKRNKLHIVDYGVDYGCQWPDLLAFLAEQRDEDGGPPEVRMTCIDLPEPGFRPAARVQETGRRLTAFARQRGLPFEFCSVAARWETVRAGDLGIDPDEVLVVNSIAQFHSLMDDVGEQGTPSPRDVVLGNIRDMRPDVLVLSVINASYNALFFLTRFKEALFYYQAMFDILDATAARDDEQRMAVERDLLGRCALNVVACEGADRVERPETYKQWQARNLRAGLRQLPLCPDIAKALSERARRQYHRDFVSDVDRHWLVQGWKGRILYAMSTWVAADG